jgi:hypothetical protein
VDEECPMFVLPLSHLMQNVTPVKKIFVIIGSVVNNYSGCLLVLAHIIDSLISYKYDYVTK